jgi:hypothetical protein
MGDMSLADGFGIAAFVIAIVLGSLELYRSLIHLQMKVFEIDIVDRYESTYLVLFHLAFVNPSLLGKTVYLVERRMPKSVISVEPPHQYSENRSTVRYLLPNWHDYYAAFSVDEMLQPSLDILPHQSVVCWYALWLCSGLPDKDSGSYEVDFVALDVGKHHLATCRASVRAEIGLYDNPYR